MSLMVFSGGNYISSQTLLHYLFFIIENKYLKEPKFSHLYYSPRLVKMRVPGIPRENIGIFVNLFFRCGKSREHENKGQSEFTG